MRRRSTIGDVPGGDEHTFFVWDKTHLPAQNMDRQTADVLRRTQWTRAIRGKSHAVDAEAVSIREERLKLLILKRLPRLTELERLPIQLLRLNLIP